MDHEGVTATGALELRRQRIQNQAAGSNAAEAAAMVLTEIHSFDLVVLLAAIILDRPESDLATVDWDGARRLASSFSGPKQAAVELAASLARGEPLVVIADLAELDDDDLQVALRAIGHARRRTCDGLTGLSQAPLRPDPDPSWVTS